MDSTHVAASSITALIGSVLVYATHFPLQPLDANTSMAIAGLLVALGGACVKLYKARFRVAGNEPPPNG